MKSLFTPAVILLLFVLPAAAQDGPVSDILYLADADVDWGIENCITAAFLDHVNMGVYLMCPSYPFISGLEFGLEITGRTYTALTPVFPTGPASDLSWDTDEPGFVDISILFDSPLTAAETVPLGTIDVFYLDTGVIEFTLTAASPSSLTDPSPLYVADPGQVLVPVTAAVSQDSVSFCINCQCTVPLTLPAMSDVCGPLADEDMSWGAVKSLYR